MDEVSKAIVFLVYFTTFINYFSENSKNHDIINIKIINNKAYRYER